MINEDHSVWMREAYHQALYASTIGEVPVGAVVVRNGRVIGAGHNQPIRSCDPTAHAEIMALKEAACTMGNYRLNAAALYVTVEPCLMCAGALIHARIDILVYGVAEPKTGAVCSVMRALDHPALNHSVEVISGILEPECRELMQVFFRDKRISVG